MLTWQSLPFLQMSLQKQINSFTVGFQKSKYSPLSPVTPSWAMQTDSATKRTETLEAGFFKLAAALKAPGPQQILTASSNLH